MKLWVPKHAPLSNNVNTHNTKDCRNKNAKGKSAKTNGNKKPTSNTNSKPKKECGYCKSKNSKDSIVHSHNESECRFKKQDSTKNASKALSKTTSSALDKERMMKPVKEAFTASYVESLQDEDDEDDF